MSEIPPTDLVRYEQAYHDNYGFERHMVRFRRRQIMACMADVPHARVLEVGCGLEPLFAFASGWQRWTVVEPSAHFAANAREAAAECMRQRDDVRVDVHEATLEEAADALRPSRDEAYDFVVVSSLLHEVPDAQALLAAVRTLCGPETVVHVNVPNAASLHNRIALQMGLIDSLFVKGELAHTMQRARTYDNETLEREVAQAGFRVDQRGSYFLKPFTNGQLDRMLALGIIDEQVLDGLCAVNAEFDGLGAEIFVQLRVAS